MVGRRTITFVEFDLRIFSITGDGRPPSRLVTIFRLAQHVTELAKILVPDVALAFSSLSQSHGVGLGR
jgi:hypothetical protein